ncbi:peptidylprolyl isomerase [Roseibacillus ishigakijimensis]|uniref:Peptidylprolyl isomerase n=1 Tax=Roseibacillus ishigakijimensis TaxID=454146 RepID=A0A934RTP4_9BACT|nr:peptidylprolyl isomerase [Roseibacillus ishigakijimensis]MBK1834864.1 peptidylprolyl isomerase [Roseibacillus ishigakijimensis]
MKVDSGAPIRAVLYGLALLYLFLDLFVFKGPLQGALKDSDPRSEKAVAEVTARGVAARVYYQPILLTQVDWAVRDRLWKQGRAAAELTADELFLHRLAALDRLFDEHFLRIKVRHNLAEISVSPEKLAAEVRAFKARFENEQVLREALAAQGWQGEEELIARVRAKLEQEAYLERYVALEIPESEIRSYYEENRHHFTLPERLRARHVFIATASGEKSDAGARQELEEVRELLRDGRDFAQLAEEFSEDASSRQRGGDLGWMSRERLPADFAESLFALSGKEPSLVRTSLGWHLVEVLERKPARERSFAEIRQELQVALANRQRENGVREYLQNLRRREGNHLEIFRDVLKRPWSL